MSIILIIVTIFMVFLPVNIFGAVIDSKALSPSSNVHVDIVNHVAASLAAHANQFHYSWRDYALIFLLVVILGTILLLCCGVVVFCLYRRLLFNLGRRSSSARVDRPTGTLSTIT